MVKVTTPLLHFCPLDSTQLRCFECCSCFLPLSFSFSLYFLTISTNFSPLDLVSYVTSMSTTKAYEHNTVMTNLPNCSVNSNFCSIYQFESYYSSTNNANGRKVWVFPRDQVNFRWSLFTPTTPLQSKPPMMNGIYCFVLMNYILHAI